MRRSRLVSYAFLYTTQLRYSNFYFFWLKNGMLSLFLSKSEYLAQTISALDAVGLGGKGNPMGLIEIVFQSSHSFSRQMMTRVSRFSALNQFRFSMLWHPPMLWHRPSIFLLKDSTPSTKWPFSSLQTCYFSVLKILLWESCAIFPDVLNEQNLR